MEMYKVSRSLPTFKNDIIIRGDTNKGNLASTISGSGAK